MAATAKISSQVNILSWILIIALLIMAIKCSYPLIILLDLLQYLYLHIYILALPLPYLYMNAMAQLSIVNFTFLPKLFTDTSATTNPYYQFQTDTTFLGNMQPLVFFAAIYLSIYFVFWLLTLKKVNCWSWRRKVKKIFKSRMRYSFIN